MFRARAHFGAPPEVVDFEQAHPERPRTESLIGRVALTKRPVHIADLESDPDYSYHARAQSAVAIANAELFETVELQRTELARFLSPEVAALVSREEGKRLLAGHRAYISVVYFDLRGFTAFAEAAEPEELIEVIGEYHALAVRRAMGLRRRLAKRSYRIAQTTGPSTTGAATAKRFGRDAGRRDFSLAPSVSPHPADEPRAPARSSCSFSFAWLFSTSVRACLRTTSGTSSLPIP